MIRLRSSPSGVSRSYSPRCCTATRPGRCFGAYGSNAALQPSSQPSFSSSDTPPLSWTRAGSVTIRRHVRARVELRHLRRAPRRARARVAGGPGGGAGCDGACPGPQRAGGAGDHHAVGADRRRRGSSRVGRLRRVSPSGQAAEAVRGLPVSLRERGRFRHRWSMPRTRSPSRAGARGGHAGPPGGPPRPSRRRARG